jgi:hypothetical protein
VTTFAETVTHAVADIAEHGFDSEERLARWMDAIRAAAHRDLVPEAQVEHDLREALGAVYRREVDLGGMLRANPEIDRFTFARLQPRLRAELDRRIMASANLIRLNRAAKIEETVRRFAGWTISVPAGGSDVIRRNPVKSDIRKALTSLPYEDRRVATDQAHKFAASLADVVATDGGAIAAEWKHHHSRYPRPEHVARAGKVYLIRDSWAHKAGLVKPGPAGYTDEVTRPGEEVLCRCTYLYRFAPSRLPPEMLTAKGRAEIERVKGRQAA